MSDENTLSAFLAGWEVFREAALASTVAGATLGVLGVYVVLRRMVFLSAALSQAAGFGVALTFYLHVLFASHLVPPLAGALIMTSLTAALMLGRRSEPGSSRDASLGFAYLMGAAGTLALGTRIVEETQDIQSILFGSAVAVAPEDLRLLLFVAAGTLALHAWWNRGFVLAAFDRDGAQVRGLPVRLLDVSLIGTLALATSVGTRLLGALPVLAFTVLPAMAAIRLTTHVQQTLVVAGAIGALCGLGGYVVAFMLELPVGAAQTLVAGLVVVLATVASPCRLTPSAAWCRRLDPTRISPWRHDPDSSKRQRPPD